MRGNGCALIAALLLAFPLAAETATRPDVPSPYVERTVITGLSRPVALAFLPDGRLLIAEQGRPAYDEAFLKLWDPNTSSITTYATVSGADLYANTEAGLIGLAVGLAVAVGLLRLLTSVATILDFGARPFVVGAATVLIATTLAALVSLLGTARIDPAQTLRAE